ncbi:coiled [Lycorma delicatula]|uniref:coiled n=1 Tax=Lycorma delicatula TaxID=130591 RepID=UPI003F50EA65
MNVIQTIILLTTFFIGGQCLECYVCLDQGDNSGKCKQTIKTCEQGDDMCLTEIVWGTTPYWSQGAQKQYYVSKNCATRKHCEKLKSKYMRSCTHIWYEDWKCAECCAGDRCNYYVILSGSTAGSSVIILASGLSFVFLARRFLI